MFRAEKKFMQQRLHRALLLFLFTVILLPRFSFAQTSHFRNYSVDDGLPFVQVYTIFQDSKGYLWSGGYGGLSRFDGKSFANFSPRDGLPNHWVTSITEDVHNNLWVGTIDGVAQYSNEKFQTFTSKNGLPSNDVNCLLRDESNIIWIGTAKGLCRYDGAKFSAEQNSVIAQKNILCLYEEPNSQRIWIGTSSGVDLFQSGKYTHYSIPSYLDSAVTALTLDGSGHILAGTHDGIFQLAGDHFELLFTPEGMEMPSVNAMLTDRQGKVWIGADNGLYMLGKQATGENIFSLKKISATDANAEKVVSLFVDYEDNLWLGTHAGLFRYRGEGFVSFGISDGLASSFVYGISKNKNDILWVCSEANGVYRYDTRTVNSPFTAIGKQQGLASNHTNDCLSMPDGSVFVGTDRGLSRITANGIVNFTRKNGLLCDSVYCLMSDKKGNVWLGGETGLTLYSNGVFTKFPMPHRAGEHFSAWFLHEDRNGMIWIGTYLGGLFRFDPATKIFVNAGNELHIDADSYFSICEDNDGRLYFGTLDGLFIYDGKTVDHVTEADGLSSELIYCMVIDHSNFLWIGSNQGLSRFDINAYAKNKSKVISTFGKEEGFMGVECNSNGAYIDDDGTMWFGTVNGLIRYSPKLFRSNNAYTRTNITGMKLFYNDTMLANGAELSYYENNLSFEYTGICLTNPSKVLYRYMLVGFDTGWSPATSERIARYSNLPPGAYTFKVISCNNEGTWSPNAAQISFVIATPVWKRAWFWLLLTAISVGIIIFGIRLRIRQIRRREQVMSETRVAMARNELKALRAQMNPHFVFNSLNSIQHFILTNKSADAGKYLNKFARLMRVILNNSEKSLISVSEEMEYMKLYLELEEMRFEGKFNWKIDIAEDIDTDYFEIPAMLLQPYVENAILHGLMPKGGGGLLEITGRLEKNTLVFSVIDNGIGREKAREMRQLSQRKDHRSLGMKITHDRLELINSMHGSQLSVTITDLRDEKNEPCGTRVDIFIPVS